MVIFLHSLQLWNKSIINSPSESFSVANVSKRTRGSHKSGGSYPYRGPLQCVSHSRTQLESKTVAMYISSMLWLLVINRMVAMGKSRRLGRLLQTSDVMERRVVNLRR